MQTIEEAKQHAVQVSNSYSGDSINGLSPTLTRDTDTTPASPPRNDATSLPMQRKTLRKDPNAPDDEKGGRRRFSRRHSKNGLAAVF